MELAGLEVDTEPPERLQIVPDWALPDDLRQRPPQSGVSVAVPVRLTHSADRPALAALRPAFGHGAQLQRLAELEAGGTFKPELAFGLPDEVSRRALLAGALKDGFVMAHSERLELVEQLVELNEDGRVRAEAVLPGEPTALEVAGGTVFVATRSPDMLAAYRAGSLEPLWKRAIQFAGSPAAAFGETPSTSPVSIAATAQSLWLVTGGRTGGAVIAHLDLDGSGPAAEGLTVPPYQETVAFELGDMHLVAAEGAVWGAVGHDARQHLPVRRERLPDLRRPRLRRRPMRY